MLYMHTVYTVYMLKKSEERRDLPSPIKQQYYPNEGNQFRATPSRQLMSAHAPPHCASLRRAQESGSEPQLTWDFSWIFPPQFSTWHQPVVPQSEQKTSSKGKGV